MGIPEIDIQKLGGFYMMIALLSSTFCVFSIIYNDRYIYYGFFTFIYSIVSQAWDICFHHIYPKSSSPTGSKQPFGKYFIVQGVALLAYLYLLIFQANISN